MDLRTLGAAGQETSALGGGAPDTRPLRGRRAGRWLGLLLGAAMLSATPVAWPQMPSQYDVEAAYLYNFGKFLRLPSGPSAAARSSFDFCVLGKSDLSGPLEKLTANEQKDQLPERTVRVASAADARGCAVVYISNSEGARLEQDLAELADAPVLTVSDMPQFLVRGGTIQFLMVNSRVRFAVNLHPTERNGISLGSELLKVAVSVGGTTGGGTP